MATVGYAIGLTVIWVMAWGTLSVANVAGGFVVAALLLAIAPDTWPLRAKVRIRPFAIVRFAGYVLSEVLIANWHLAQQVLSRNPSISTGVVAMPLPESSDALVTLIANTIALTPGTMPVEIEYEPTIIYVHFLQLSDAEEGRRALQRLARFAYAAFGSDEGIAALHASIAQHEEALRS